MTSIKWRDENFHGKLFKTCWNMHKNKVTWVKMGLTWKPFLTNFINKHGGVNKYQRVVKILKKWKRSPSTIRYRSVLVNQTKCVQDFCPQFSTNWKSTQICVQLSSVRNTENNKILKRSVEMLSTFPVIGYLLIVHYTLGS